MKRLAPLFCLALVLASCGSDTSNKGGSNGSGGGSITEPSQIAPALWNELCDAAFTCPDASPEIVLLLGRYSSATACKADVNALPLDLQFGQIEVSIEEGRATFDSARADICLARIRESLCAGRGFENVAECEDVIVGQVAEGGGCAAPEECSGQLECRDEGNECYGTCVPNCGETTCTETQFCDAGDVCTERLASGGECSSDAVCGEGLICNFNEQTCVEMGSVAEGGACDRDRECADGLACSDGLCTAAPAQIAPGQPCRLDDDVQQVCQAGSVCTDFSISAGGAEGTCGPAKALGGSCRVFLECEPGLTCSATDPLVEGECVDQYANGEACQEDFDCQSEICNGGNCVERGAEQICELPAT